MIDKGVPVRNRRGRIAEYPFRDMEVGDSMLVEGRSQNAVINLGRYHGIQHGMRFTTSREGNAVRIWRVA